MNDDIMQLDNAIREQKQKVNKLKSTINKLQTEAGQKLEYYNRMMEKKRALESESQQKDSQLEEIQRILEKNMNTEITKSGQMFFNYKDVVERYKIFQQSEERDKVREKFKSKIEKEIDEKAKASLKKDDEEPKEKKEEEKYSKSSIIHAIGVVLEEVENNTRDQNGPERNTEEGQFLNEPTRYYTTFRVAQNTTFRKLRECAAKFWGKEKESKDPNHPRETIQLKELNGLKEPSHPKEPEESIEPSKPNESKESMNYGLYTEKGEFICDSTTQKDTQIERFFKFRIQEMTQLQVMLRPAVSNKKEGSSKKNANQNVELNIRDDEEEQQRLERDLYHKYKEKMPKLMAYLPVEKSKTEEINRYKKRWMEPTTCGENNFCIILLNLILLVKIITYLSIARERNALQTFYYIDSANDVMTADTVRKITTPDQFLDSLSTLIDFFPLSLGTPLTSDDLRRNTLQLLKPIEIRQYRVKPTECKYNFPGKTCYYPYYDTTTRETESFQFAGEEYNFFTSEKGSDYLIRGSFGEYGRESYPYKFDPAVMTQGQFWAQVCLFFAETPQRKEKCKEEVASLACNDNGSICYPFFNDWVTKIDTLTDSYIHSSTRAIFVQLELIDVGKQEIFHLQPGVELGPAGIFVPHYERPLAYKLSFKQNSSVSQGTIKTFSGIIGTFLLIFILYILFTSGSNGGVNIRYFMTLQGALNLLIVVFNYYIISLMNSYDGKELSLDKIIKNDSSIGELRPQAGLYERVLIFKSVLVCMLFVRVALIFKLNSRVEIIITAFERGIPILIEAMIIILPFVLVVAYLGHVFFGVTNQNYTTYGDAVKSIVLLAIGIDNNELSKQNGKSGIFIFMVVFCVYLMASAVFSSIYVESFRHTMLDYGHEFHANSSWKFNQFVKWAFAWVPKRVTLQKEKLKKQLALQKQKFDELKNKALHFKDNLNLSKKFNFLKKKKKQEEKPIDSEPAEELKTLKGKTKD